MKYVFLITSTLFLLINCSCSDSTGPKNGSIDTTSHNFTWTIDTVGIEGSWLSDIAVIDEDEIWAVGRLESDTVLNDDRNTGNLAQWDGNKWVLTALPYTLSNGGITYSDGLNLFRFKTGEIILSNGGNMQIWNGSSYNAIVEHIPLLIGPVYKIWGDTISNYYLVGYQGMILHYNNGLWSNPPSGTDIDLRDMDGYDDHKFIVGFNPSIESVVMELRDNGWETIFSSSTYFGDLENGDYGRTTAVRVFEDKAYIVSKTGIIIYNYKTKKSTLVPADEALMTGHDFYHISGKENDLLLVGKAGHIIHYNGNTWHMYENYVGIPGLQVRAGYIKANTIATCGDDYINVATIIRGTRN